MPRYSVHNQRIYRRRSINHRPDQAELNNRRRERELNSRPVEPQWTYGRDAAREVAAGIERDLRRANHTRSGIASHSYHGSATSHYANPAGYPSYGRSDVRAPRGRTQDANNWVPVTPSDTRRHNPRAVVPESVQAASFEGPRYQTRTVVPEHVRANAVPNGGSPNANKHAPGTRYEDRKYKTRTAMPEGSSGPQKESSKPTGSTRGFAYAPSPSADSKMHNKSPPKADPQTYDDVFENLHPMERQAAARKAINAILPMERPYRLRLGLNPNQTLTRTVISAAYRKQALRWHPDRFKESERGFAQHMTIELNEAKDKFVELCDNLEILQNTNPTRG